MNIFLDDERFPSDQGIKFDHIVRNYEDFVKLITEQGLPIYISFDHDLGEGENGLDCAKWLVDYCLDNDLKPSFDFYVHSQNFIGKENIEKLLTQFKSYRR